MTYFLTSEKLPARDGEFDIKGIFPSSDPNAVHEGLPDGSEHQSFVAYYKTDPGAWYRVNPDTRQEPGNDITAFVTAWAEVAGGDLPQGHAMLGTHV